MRGRFLFLGTGGSTGVPVIGCRCAVCLSSSPKNQRLRPSGVIYVEGKALLIDVGPDFRQQALLHQLSDLEGLLLTHTHFDHIAGIDELRIFYIWQNRPFPVLLSLKSFEDLKKRYDYLFEDAKKAGTLTAQLACQVLDPCAGRVKFLGVDICYCYYFQGGMQVTGFRIGNFAYISDIKQYDERLFESLQGVKHLVVSALKEEISPLHFSFQNALDFCRKIGADQTYLTHLSHAVDYDLVASSLPLGVKLAYDGLEVDFEY